MQKLTANAKGTVKDATQPDGKFKLPVVTVSFDGVSKLAEAATLKYFQKGEDSAVEDLNAYTVIQVQNAGRAAMVALADSGERNVEKLSTAAKAGMNAFINGERKARVGTMVSWDKAVAFWQSAEGKANPARKAADAAMTAAKATQDELAKADAVRSVVCDYYRANKPATA